MGRIITKALIQEAIEMTRPAAIAVLRTEGAIWGPKRVNCFAEVFGVEERVPFSFSIEEADEVWHPEWKDPDRYPHVAGKKLDLSMRHKLNSSVIVALFPALLEDGEFLYAGAAYRMGIGGASASGARSWADEAIADIFLVNLNMLVQRERNHRIEIEVMEI